MPREFTYEIEEEIATLSSYEGARGRIYSKELSLISYNGANAVYDIRNWTGYHDEEARMGKGITLNKEELKALRDALNGMDL